jgi:phosphate transport system substrate-binding protein
MKSRRGPLLLTAALCLACGSCSGGDDISIQGAGATFPAPLYKRWFLEYYKQHPDVRVNYQAIGSGAGISRFTQRLVDFAASDAAMSDEQMAKVEGGVVLLPMTAGSIVLSYNLPDGPPVLKLSRKALAGIAMAEITSWDDPAIAEANKGVQLPHVDIAFVHRSDGSGTTFAFTKHLSAISPEWKKRFGVGTSIDWPSTTFGGKGNNGVAAFIDQTPGAIGYVEYGYADLVHLPMAWVQNKAGEYVKPTPESAQAGLAEVKFPEKVMRAWVEDPAGKKAYPIVTYTWMLCYKQGRDPAATEALRRVLRYCLSPEAQVISPQLGYVALPEAIRRRVLKAVDRISP